MSSPALAREHPERRASDVRIPRWALGIILGFILQAMGWVLSYGELRATVQMQNERLQHIEQRLDDFENNVFHEEKKKP